MKTPRSMIFVALLLAATGAWSDEEDEVKVPESNVPKPVLDAVVRKFPTAKSRTFEKETKHGVTQYEAQVEVGEGAKARKSSVDISEQGAILAEEEVISFADLPDAVKNAHQASPYAKAQVGVVEREIKDGKTTFEVAVVAADGKRELVYDAQGVLVKVKDKGKGKGKVDTKR